VTRFTLEAADFLVEHDIKALVVACNTASAYALPALEERLRLPVVGVIEAGARAAAEVTAGGRIGVIATSATVASGAYERALARVAPGAEVVARACPLFVPLVEEGWTHHAVTRLVAEEYLAELRGDRIDTLILGCTHYPLLHDVISETLGREVRLVDSGEHAARAVAERLEELHLRASPSPAEPEHRIFLTDLPPAFRTTSERFLGRRLPPVEVIRWQDERWVRA
jgi:glutamate racemase